MYRYNQHSFVGGQLDRGLMGRQDLERYFQGASKLENFIVRKQGNITKRRGSEMMADLGDLFGTGDAIAYSRIIPFSYEISGGYYLLFAESSGDTHKRGTFVITDTGLQHKFTITKSKLDESGAETEEKEESEVRNFLPLPTYTTEYSTETREIKNEEGVVIAIETWRVITVTAPAIINTPYTGEEFAEIGYNQSGDTLFLAHKNHPPTKIVNSKLDFKFEFIDFAAKKWYPPRIVSITPKGTWGTSNSTKSISYVCTYVKDGIESMPSEEFQVSYDLPWGNTCKFEIKVDKGNNETEPDYYNIYKKDSSQFGIISTVGSPVEVSPIIPTLQGTVLYPNVNWSGSQVNEKPLSTYYKYNESIFLGTLTGRQPNIIGGATTPDGVLTIDFGENSGLKITSFELQLDAFTSKTTRKTGGRVVDYYLTYYRHGTATYFTAAVVFSDGGNLSQVEFSTSVELPEYSPVTLKSGHSSLNNSTSYVTNPNIERLKRSARFDFSSFISNNNTLKNSQTWQVKSITVTFYDNITNKTKVEGFFHGMRFTNALKSADTFQDDYITPNIAFTPPIHALKFANYDDYPSCVAIYTQRLTYASSKNQPFTWWMSCVGDLSNFNTHASIRQDDAIEVTVPATEFPNINHMVLSRDLVLFCDNGEWVVRPLTGNTLAYDTVECKKQSAIGCAKSVPPLQVGDEIIFTDNSKRVVRSIKYQFTSDGYESNDLSILSQSIFFTNPVVSMCYKQHPESLILCELADGSVAALVYMKEHNVVAWTHHTLGGGWKCRGIASNKAHAEETTHVAMLVENDDGGVEIWRIRDDDESSNLADQLCMDGLRFALGSEIGAVAFENGQAVIDLENGQRINSTAELVADKEYAVGYPFTSTFASVRPEPQGSETFQWELKNAKKVHIRTLNGSSFQVKEAGLGDDYASKVEIERVIADGEVTQPGLVDATDILLNGENSRDGRIEIKHDGILPLTIESFSVDYETQPLYQSEG